MTEYPWAVIDETINRAVDAGKTTWLDEAGEPLEWPVRIGYRGVATLVPRYHEDLKHFQEFIIPSLEGEYGWVICSAEIQSAEGPIGFRVNIMTSEGPSFTAFHESLAAAYALALYAALV